MYSVVLVDDERIIVEGLKKIVPWADYNCQVVATASDGVEGARIIREKRPDILFTDIRMPLVDGLTMVAGLKSEFSDMQIAVLTAYRDFDYAQRAISLGVCRFLLKPSRIDEIKEAVSYMVSRLPVDESSQQADADNASGFVVKAALKYISDNYMTHLSLTDVAQNVFVSQWHLSKLLNRHTGKSFFELVNEERVKNACELLRDPTLRIRDVAELVGCADVAHFSKIFKKSRGVSPAAFRARL